MLEIARSCPFCPNIRAVLGGTSLRPVVTTQTISGPLDGILSTHPLRCSTCGKQCAYDRCAPFGEGQETTYAVSWRCRDGHSQSLDVCPVGPLIPANGLCLNCGAPYGSDAEEPQCGACGLSRRNCPAALEIADTPDDEPLASARTAFGQGLFRRGIAILNQALQENMAPRDAWILKSRFLHSIGFDRAAIEMIDGALTRYSGTADRIELLEELSFLSAEGDDGERALQSADAAAALGSNSIRTHYLRGRALGLLGQLRDARSEMLEVLKLDPDNADAHRALPMIDAAIGPQASRHWWQFWK